MVFIVHELYLYDLDTTLLDEMAQLPTAVLKHFLMLH